MYNFEDVTRKLVLQAENGTTNTGKIKTKNYTFNDLSETASAEAVNQAAEALGGLISGPIVNIYVNDKNEVLDN